MTALRVVFMGTPDFAVPTFAAIVDAGHDVAAVYTRAPRPAGRGMAERRSPVHELAEARGISVLTPASLRDPPVQETFDAHAADVAVVVAYGLLLPRAVLAAPRDGCLNLHASLLPRWRGAAPIQRAIMAGDRETGICVMRMDEGLDTGPVCLLERVAIGARETAGELHDRLAATGADLMVRALAATARHGLECMPQPEAGITYAHKISKDEARIDWSRPAAVIDCQIRGLSPCPGAWFVAPDGSTRIRILRAEPVAGEGFPGTVLDDRLTVACGEGALRPALVQRQGRAAMTVAEFLRGFPLAPGSRLG